MPPKQSPQQQKPLIDPSLPRDPKTKQILSPEGKKVGSKQPQFYDELEDTPEYARMRQLETQIDEWRIRGQLWTEYDPDSPVTKALKEYDELQKQLHPQKSNPLNFAGEFDEEEEENPNQ